MIWMSKFSKFTALQEMYAQHVTPLSAIPGERTGFGFRALTSCCSPQELKYRLESRPGY